VDLSGRRRRTDRTQLRRDLRGKWRAARHYEA
jgi:hypothetical protein